MTMSMPRMDMGMDMTQVSSITTCENDGEINAGDEWSVTAFYNTTKYAPMMDSDNTLAPIMGISVLFAPDKGVAAIPGSNNTTETANNASTTSTASAASATSTGAAAAAVVPVGGLVAGVMAALFM